ncbi:hypothetical protein [Virgibacillus halodenitrificans]|uniref:hypothetical protein n=1 Tax=Virgibacillus halodenitrificans TaxID=1482 RepID=UPI001F26EE08|nr:hypothetical protein [Virgibacillus halodenitrificans]
MKRILLLLSILIIILVGCSDKNDASITPEKKRDLTYLLEIIYDDTFKEMTSEVYTFTQGYFQPLYINKEGIDILGYTNAIILLRRSIDNASTYLEDKDIKLGEFENEDEAAKVLRLHKELIDSAYDYALLFEDWIISDELEQRQIALSEAYDSLITYKKKAEDYTKIYEEFNFKEIPKIVTGLDIGNKTEDNNSSNFNHENETKVNIPTNNVEDKPSNNPADYNSNDEYKPVDEMTQEEIQEELEEILGDAIGK